MKRKCEKCGEMATIYRHQIGSGFHLRVWCGDHETGHAAMLNKDGGPRPFANSDERTKLTLWLINHRKSFLDLPLWDPPYRDGTRECEVCREFTPTEVHHLAPAEVFGDMCDYWPIVNVCRKCHIEWHQKMRGYSGGPKR